VSGEVLIMKVTRATRVKNFLISPAMTCAQLRQVTAGTHAVASQC
jgi:hypothetical protein